MLPDFSAGQVNHYKVIYCLMQKFTSEENLPLKLTVKEHQTSRQHWYTHSVSR